MKCLLLDLKTNRVKWHSGPSTFDWTENNWSCDCNRAVPFGDWKEGDGHCLGGHRYIVVDYINSGDDDYNVKSVCELNSDYGKEVVSAALEQYKILMDNVVELREAY